MQNKLFLKAADICELLDVKQTSAYEIIDLKIRPYFEKKILSEITVADVRAWQNELLMYKWIRL